MAIHINVGRRFLGSSRVILVTLTFISASACMFFQSTRVALANSFFPTPFYLLPFKIADDLLGSVLASLGPVLCFDNGPRHMGRACHGLENNAGLTTRVAVFADFEKVWDLSLCLHQLLFPWGEHQAVRLCSGTAFNPLSNSAGKGVLNEEVPTLLEIQLTSLPRT